MNVQKFFTGEKKQKQTSEVKRQIKTETLVKIAYYVKNQRHQWPHVLASLSVHKPSDYRLCTSGANCYSPAAAKTHCLIFPQSTQHYISQ